MPIRATLNCLHGFLGSSDDWDSIFPDPFDFGIRCVKYDLFGPLSKVASGFSLPELGGWINTVAGPQTSPRVLLGYSLGGRIALHSLLQSPESWNGAIIVSAHLGFQSDQNNERLGRIKVDENWAHKFETGQWDDVVSEWDAQAVFSQPQISGHPENRKAQVRQVGQEMRISRFETDFSRIKLANCLRTCSLGHQIDLRSDLRQLQVPILWISGEQDAKYRSIAQEAAELNPRFKSVVIPGGGHRIPWERPTEFTQLVVAYLGQLNLIRNLGRRFNKGRYKDGKLDSSAKVAGP